MWRPVVVTVAPAAEPLALADAKAHLIYEDDDKDDLIGDYVAAARAMVEARTGTRLYTQTVSLKTDDWPDLANLPVAPIQSISSIAYTDINGDVVTLSGTVYEARLDLLEPTVVLKYNQAFPSRQAGSLITVTAVVGYGAAGAQPPEVLHAVRLILGDFFAHRETVGDSAISLPVAATVDALLANHTKFLI